MTAQRRRASSGRILAAAVGAGLGLLGFARLPASATLVQAAVGAGLEYAYAEVVVAAFFILGGCEAALLIAPFFTMLQEELKAR
ncbi:MAG: hypothetical protein RIF44_07665 [Nitratireductor sp.]